MLSNAYFLAKFRFDTAENEPAKNLQNFANFPNFEVRQFAHGGPCGGVTYGRFTADVSRPADFADPDFDPVESPRQACTTLDWSANFANAFSKNAFFENFANFWRARSRLYQNEILQENMRLTAFFKLYKICILLHRCNLKIFAKNRFEKTAIFVKFQQKIANVAKFAKFC